MSLLKPEYQDMSIVLIGNMNPKIFQPAWFAKENLIKASECDKSNIEIIHNDVTIFSLPDPTPWLRVEVTRDRFMASTTQQPYYRPTYDLVLSTFKLLCHAPVSQMGINLSMHFKVDSEKKWHEVGHKLAPKELWEGILREPGMRSLTMQSKKTGDEPAGFINVKIEPSARSNPGVHFSVNDHVKTLKSEPTDCNEIVEVLENTWEESIENSKRIIDSILEKLL